MQFSVHGLWRWRGRGGFYFSTSFFPSWNLFLPSPLQAAHIQRWAIIPVDLPCSSNGVRVSEGFSLCISQSHVAGRLSREEVRSQLPGDRDCDWNGCDLFCHRAKSKQGKCGQEEFPPPTPSLIKGCYSIVLREAVGRLVVVEGEGRRRLDMKREEADKWGEVSEILAPAQLRSFRFSPTPFSALLDTFQLPYKHWSPWNETLVLPSFLTCHVLMKASSWMSSLHHENGLWAPRSHQQPEY